MKVEGGGVATSSGAPASVLHRIKVKEETKDCAGALQTSSNVSPPPRSLAIGAIATITISSGCELTPAPTSAAPVPAVEPVDLDLKSAGARAKAVSRDKVPPREDVNGTESRGSSSPSPSSSPGSHYNHQQQQKLQSRAASFSSTRSPDSDDCPPLQALKTEAQDDVRQPQDEPKSEANGSGNGGRCISGIFAAHGKLKRLLGTLVQFAMDISPDTGDTVRTLVLGLLSGSMTAEEFHSALQEATNFPLRGFVLPYLKHTLPSLQRDLSAAARADNQTCGQYLRSNEAAVLEAVGLVSAGASTGSTAGAAEDPFGTEHVLTGHSTLAQHYAMRPSAMHPVAAAPPHLGFGIGVAAKRRASDAMYYENGALFDDGPPYPKRSSNPWSQHPHPQHPQHPHQHQQPQQPPTASHHHLPHHQQQQQHPSAAVDSAYNCWYSHPLSAHGHGPSGLPGYGPLGAAVHLSHQPVAAHAAANPGSAPSQNGSASSSLDDEWKNIHVMLNCILGMVEKTKRALAILQKRGCTSPAAAAAAAAAASANGAAQPANNGAQQQSQESSGQDRDGSFKRLSGEIVAQTIRATEDRVAEVKRRAEEAVQEVKRVAMAEVQRAVAVAVAESRASERRRYLDNLPLAQQPRAHHGRPVPFLPTAARATGTGSASDDVDKEAHPGSSCWNCGRSALETCGGCGVARYCGSFCQHRDWEAGGHHATCATTTGSTSSTTAAQPDRSSTPSPTTGESNLVTDPAKSAPRIAK